MATLKQNPTSFAKYLIFFGECNSNSESFDLTSTDTVLRATEYTEDGTGIASYDSNVTFSFLQDFTELKSGHIYEVMLKKGDSELIIDGVFHSFNTLSTSAKVTPECSSVNNPTPTPEQTPTPTPTPVQPTPTPTPVQPTPTPTPVAPIVCCDGKTIVTAENDDKGVSLASEAVAGGTLCFESTDTTPGDNKTFHCKYENEAFACSVSLDLEQGLDAIKDKIFRYELGGNCFEADFTGFNDQDFGPVMKLISTSTPVTPTPVDTDCCAGMDQSMVIVEGEETPSVNQISVTGSSGTLCWNSTTGFTSPETYLVSFGDDSYSLGGLQISLTGNLEDNTFKFNTEAGICYEGKLENPAPIITVFIETTDNTPTPVSNPTPTPTPLHTPTPTPVPVNLSGCCEGMDFSVNIVNGNAERSLVNQISANGEDGTLCWKALTGFASNKSYTISLGDASFADGGVGVNVTGVFSDTKFRFVRSSTGVCYEGRLETEAPTANVFLPVSEDATPTPTQTQTPLSTPECCDGLTTITKGQDSAGVSFPTEGVDGGTLCFESLNSTPGANKAFHCMYPNNTFAFTVAFDLLNGQNSIADSTIRYEINDKCYMVDLRGVADQAVVTLQEVI